MYVLVIALGASALGLYVAYQGLVGGYVRRSLPGGAERPQGWTGDEAKLVGLYQLWLGLATATIGVGLIAGWASGHANDVEWSSVPAFLVVVPPGILSGAAGISAILLGRRNRDLRWGLAGISFLVISALALIVWTTRIGWPF